MIIYNVTTKLDPSIADAWLKWTKEEHIPDLIKTGCFTGATTLRIIEVDDSEGPTYAVQYHANSKEDYDAYIQEYAPKMREKVLEKWGNKFISFRSVLEVLH